MWDGDGREDGTCTVDIRLKVAVQSWLLIQIRILSRYCWAKKDAWVYFSLIFFGLRFNIAATRCSKLRKVPTLTPAVGPFRNKQQSNNGSSTVWLEPLFYFPCHYWGENQGLWRRLSCKDVSTHQMVFGSCHDSPLVPSCTKMWKYPTGDFSFPFVAGQKESNSGHN